MERTYDLTGGKKLLISRDNDADSPREWATLWSFATWHDKAELGDIALSRHSGTHMIFQVADAVLGKAQADVDRERHIAEGNRFLQCVKARKALSLAIHKAEISDYMDETESILKKALDKVAIIKPLYLHEHSGMSVSLKPFSDPWDSGQVGLCFVTYEKLRHELSGGKWVLMTSVCEGSTVTRKNVWIPGSGILNAKRIASAMQALEIEVETLDAYLRGDVWGIELVDESGVCLDSCWGFYGNNILTNGILDHIENHEDRKILVAASSASDITEAKALGVETFGA